MNLYKARLLQFHNLNVMQKRTVLAAWLWLPLFWLGLRLLGLPRFQAWLLNAPARSDLSLTLPVIKALGEAVNIAARHTPFPATCLTRSLLFGWLLRRQNVASKLRIGVRMTQGMLDAHAWVECEGIPVNDSPEVNERFASFGDLIPLKAFQTP